LLPLAASPPCASLRAVKVVGIAGLQRPMAQRLGQMRPCDGIGIVEVRDPQRVFPAVVYD